ncbi:MAG TPA: LLM class flavin-dependent oxidoreductase [Candidatus Limnocylindrales bacterium]|nr:LLM class flavin-dependent oxidoreductase [Candidatus Limnocylindrales bacterium]
MKIGMTLPQRRDDGEGTPWEDLRELAWLAEAGGVDSLWVADHYFYRDEKVEIGLHEAFTLLTAVAAVTRKVQVGPLVACTSFRSAGMLAKIAATLDAVSGGRLILGLGCGWHEAEYKAFGHPFDHRVGRFEEVVSTVRPLLRGERVSVKGRWLELDDAVIVPKPEHEVPLLIASNGPRMLDITARLADAWQAAWFGAVSDEFRSERSALMAASEAAGRTQPMEIFVGIDVNDEEGDHPRVAGDAGAIADALTGWAEEGVDHVQLRVHPGTKARFETAVEAIRRFRA